MNAEEILEVADTLASFGYAPESAAAKFVRGVEHWIREDAPSLDEALELGGGQGVRSARCRYLAAQQRHFLNQAWLEVEGSKPWPRSVELARELERFEVSIWPRWRHLDDPPPGTSRLREALFRARKLGRVPKTPRRLHDLVKSAQPIDFALCVTSSEHVEYERN